VDVFSDEGNHSGPIKLTRDVLDHLGDALVGAKDVQLDIWIVGDVEQSLIAKEVTIL